MTTLVVLWNSLSRLFLNRLDCPLHEKNSLTSSTHPITWCQSNRGNQRSQETYHAQSTVRKTRFVSFFRQFPLFIRKFNKHHCFPTGFRPTSSISCRQLTSQPDSSITSQKCVNTLRPNLHSSLSITYIRLATIYRK